MTEAERTDAIIRMMFDEGRPAPRRHPAATRQSWPCSWEA